MSESDNPHVGVVVDLVDPYFTRETKNVGGFKASSAAGSYAIWWVRNHPGRWAMVAENGAGLTRQLLKAWCPDIQVAETRPPGGFVRFFARIPHPEGEPLSQALERRPIGRRLYLPEVTRDEFDWSAEELAEACQIARDNLFPVSS